MSKPSFRILISREDEKETNPLIQHVGFRAMVNGAYVWLSHEDLLSRRTATKPLTEDTEENLVRVVIAYWECTKGGHETMNKGHFMKEAIIAGLEPLNAWSMYESHKSDVEQMFKLVTSDLKSPPPFQALEWVIPTAQRSYPRDAGKTALEMLRSRINKSGQKTNNLKKGTVGFLVEGERVETDGTVTKKKDVAPAK